MSRVNTGIEGLDKILKGGFIERCSYLIRGGPGQGKTTLGLHFLTSASKEETTLFIGFQESDEQLKANASNIGLNVVGVTFLNLAPNEDFFTKQEKYDVFASSEVEDGPLAGTIVDVVDRVKPKRVFVDSLTQLRFLTADMFQYRKEVLSFLHFLKKGGATVLFSSEHSTHTPDDDLQFLADGVMSITTDDSSQKFTVEKFRGSSFRRGTHQMRNTDHGLEIFPRPIPPREEINESRFTPLSTGISSLDDILQGGLESGTISMLTGPSGIGKSTLASSIAATTALQFGHVAVYLFEEELSTFHFRANALGIELEKAESSSRLSVDQIEPMRFLADEFSGKVYDDVKENKTRLVIIDSTAGFELNLDDESIKSRLHTLSKSLSRINVSVLLVNESSSLTGGEVLSQKGISYLADNVISMRYIQDHTPSISVIQVIKKRLSGFDNRPYRFEIGPKSINLRETYDPSADPAP